MISLVIEQAGRVRRQDLPLLPATVGRAGTADVHLDSDLASRLHARFYESEGHIWLEDLGSRNGTTLNGRHVDRVPLRCGDAVGIGDCRLTVAALTLDDELVDLKGYQWVRLEGGSVDGVLWRARQAAMAREVTVKILRGRFRGDPAVEDLFVRRAKAQSRLGKPWLQSVLDIAYGDGSPCVVLEAIDGELLSHRLERGEEFSAQEAEGLIERLLEATCELHAAGLHHGLLHPGRILLTAEGGIRITTLGFPLPSLDHWPDGPAPSLAYLPPEAASGPAAAGAAGDIYQAGAVAWRLLTGSPLRGGHDRDEILSEVSSAADEPPECGIPARSLWFSRMIDGRPVQRYATAAEALDAFRRGMRRLPVPAVQAAAGAGEPAEPARKKRLSPRFIMMNRIITVVLAIVLNGAVFLWWSGRPPKNNAETRRPPPGRIETPRPARSDPAPPALVDHPQDSAPAGEAAASRAAAYAELEASVAGWRERNRFEDALAALQEFATGNLGTREAGLALALAREVEQALLDYAAEQLAGVEAAAGSGDWELAEALRRELGTRSDRVDRVRLASVDAALARHREEAASTHAGGGDPSDPPRPAPGGGPPATGEPVSLNERAIVLLGRPLDGEARRLLMEEGGRDAFEPRVWRALSALDSAMRAWVDSMQPLMDQPLEFTLIDGSKVAGTLREANPGGFVLTVGGKAEEIAMNRFDPRAIVGLVRVGPSPRFDLYLLRALLHEAADLEEEAWFDWHAAKLAAGGDGEARRCAELGIERLERKHRKSL